MNVEELRKLFKNNSGWKCGGLKSCTLCQEYQTQEEKYLASGLEEDKPPFVYPCEYDFIDLFHDLLNLAYSRLGEAEIYHGQPEDTIKVGDFHISLKTIGILPEPKNLSAWKEYKDAFCTALFKIEETGDYFKVSGENGSWGWGALMETSLHDIEIVASPDDLCAALIAIEEIISSKYPSYIEEWNLIKTFAELNGIS